MPRNTPGLISKENKKGHRSTMALGSFYNMVDELNGRIAQKVLPVKNIVSHFRGKSIQWGPYILCRNHKEVA